MKRGREGMGRRKRGGGETRSKRVRIHLVSCRLLIKGILSSKNVLTSTVDLDNIDLERQ